MKINPYESPREMDSAAGPVRRLLNWLRGLQRREGYCSFCSKNHREVGPLVEGPNRAYVCYVCCLYGAHLIEAECERTGKPLPRPE